MPLYMRHLGAATLLAAGIGHAWAADMTVTLSGQQEAPPATTGASGHGAIEIGMDRSVHGTISTSGMAATAAHIHLGGVGVNDPVVIALERASDNEWTVPPGSKLTEEQYGAYKADRLYVNVHSTAHPAGEIRAQLQP